LEAVVEAVEVASVSGLVEASEAASVSELVAVEVVSDVG